MSTVGPDNEQARVYWLLRHECICAHTDRPDSELDYYLT